jgi:ABC-2 type transport system permease protein
MINFTIYKTELRLNLRMIFIWSFIFSLMTILTMSLFDVTRAQQATVSELLKTYPKEFIQAFKIDASSYNTVEGFFSGRSLSLMIIANSVLAVFLGAYGIGKELSSKTIGFLITKPLSRLNIYISKTAVAVTLLFICNAIFATVAFVSSRILTSDQTGSIRYFAGLFFLLWLVELIFLGLGQLISMYLSDTQAILAGVGLVFVSWIIDILGNITGIPEFVKYITPLYYIDSTYLHDNHELKLTHVLVLASVALVIMLITAWRFNRRDIEV